VYFVLCTSSYLLGIKLALEYGILRPIRDKIVICM